MAFKSTKGSGNVWNPKKDADGNDKMAATEKDFLDGYYSNRKDNVGEHGSSVFTFTNKDTGEDTDVWGDTVLTSEMDKIRIGKYARIQWHGKKLKKAFAAGTKINDKNSFHNWEVFVDDEVPPMDIKQATGQANNSANATQNNGNQNSAAGAQRGSTAGQSFATKEDDDDLPF